MWANWRPLPIVFLINTYFESQSKFEERNTTYVHHASFLYTCKWNFVAINFISKQVVISSVQMTGFYLWNPIMWLTYLQLFLKEQETANDWSICCNGQQLCLCSISNLQTIIGCSCWWWIIIWIWNCLWLLLHWFQLDITFILLSSNVQLFVKILHNGSESRSMTLANQTKSEFDWPASHFCFCFRYARSS